MNHKALFTFCFFVLIVPALSAQNHIEEKEDYHRSSLYSILIKHPEKLFCEDIVQVFNSIPILEKFNDHNLSKRTINAFVQQKKGKGKLEEQQIAIDNFLQRNAIGRRLIAKWFNRKKDGTFNMELITQRGYYDASFADIQLADLSIRGRRILADAGEKLIANTYVLVNDIRYVDKSEAADLVGGVFGIIGTIADNFTGGATSLIISSSSQLGSTISQQIAGFKVIVTSYLYRLDWNQEIATDFYTKYYTEKSDSEKKLAFDKEYNLFTLHYIGRQSVYSGKTTLRGVHSEQDMIRKVCTRALDKAIAQLQKEHEDFRVKTPLYSTEPLTAKIGIKEDIDKDSRFEVLEKRQEEDGSISYKRVGIIKPLEDKIWDNRYMAEEEEENKNNNLTATEFTKVSGGDFYPGMLIREIKIK